MSSLLWRVALLLSTLLLLPVLLIRAQPYDDGGLRDFLTPPEDCPAPCFMGIRPGVTTVDEAVQILAAHPWVLWEHESLMAYRTPFQLSWAWSEAAPAWIEPGSVALATLNHDRLVSLNLRVAPNRADYLLSFGQPDRTRLMPNDDVLTAAPFVHYRYEAWYAELGLLLRSGGACSASASSYDWPIMLFFLTEPPDLVSAAGPLVTRCHRAGR